MNKPFQKFYIVFFFAFFAVFTIISTNAAFCAPDAAQVNAQHQKAQQNVHKLRLLEKKEINALNKNQLRLERTQQNLNTSRDRYDTVQKRVIDLEAELFATLNEYNQLKIDTNKRIVQIFKTKRKNYIEFLLSSKNINDFLDRLYFENILMKNDKKHIRETQMKTRNIIELKSRIEEQRRYLERNIEERKRDEKNIQVAISQNEKMIQRLKTDRSYWEKSERELARQSEQLTGLINKSVNASAVMATGGFVRPVYGGITSYYGYRMHPIFKRQIFHSGLDIGAPMGTGIKAANSGKIIFVGWYGGYGKVVIIDHGRVNGKAVTTLYAHMSSFNVSQGDTVQKGQRVGGVGSTGYSTGPHLHFEVRVNGATVNPLNYIPG